MDAISYLLGKKAGGGSQGLTVIVVEELPETGQANILYLLPKQDTGDNDIFEEWLYVEDEWEKIGTTDIDLSNYYTKTEVDSTTGSLSSLQTTSKTNLVSAINEVLQSSGSVISTITVTWSNTFPNNLDSYSELKNLQQSGIYAVYTKMINMDDMPMGFVIVLKSSTNIRQLVIFKSDFMGASFLVSSRTYNGSTWTKFQYKSCVFPTDMQTTLTTAEGTLSYWFPVRQAELNQFYGSKIKSALTTTNKNSLVDAINEVNPKGFSGYDASKTQVLKNVNGTLTWVDE